MRSGVFACAKVRAATFAFEPRTAKGVGDVANGENMALHLACVGETDYEWALAIIHNGGLMYVHGGCSNYTALHVA